MPKPLPPDHQAVDGPNALQIGKLAADIAQLQEIQRGRDPTTQAQIADQIRQRESAQLHLYQQISGHDDAKVFGAHEKGVVVDSLKAQIAALSLRLKELNDLELEAATSPQIGRLDEQIEQLQSFVRLLAA